MRNKLWTVLSLLVVLAFGMACSTPAPSPTAAPAKPPAAAEPTKAAAPQPAAPAPAPTTAPAAKPAEKVTINWSTIAGFYTDAMSAIVKDFEAKYPNVKVNVVNIDNAQLYDKQVIEMVGKTGAYDVVTLETAEKASFAENGYILPMDDYIKANAAAVKYEDVAPILADMTTRYKGKVWGLPYYTYTAGMFYRADLWEDATEKAAFKAKYGYDLIPPETWEQHRDMAEFFTRKSGEKLKGQTLTKNFYGVGLMAGRFQEIQDELAAFLWGWGGDFIKNDGTPGVNDEVGKKAIKWYVEKLLPFAPPAALTVTYDGVMNQMQDGQIAMTAGFFLDQWPNAVNTEKKVPGAKMGVKEAPLKKAYIGGFLLAVASGSKHQKEAMDLVAYIGGPEAQKKFASMGGTTTRMSILTAPEFNVPEMRTKTGHFSTLVKVFESMKDTKSNLFYTPFGAKIYNTLGPMYQMAAAKEKTPEKAVEDLAAEMMKIMGGKPAPIYK